MRPETTSKEQNIRIKLKSGEASASFLVIIYQFKKNFFTYYNEKKCLQLLSGNCLVTFVSIVVNVHEKIVIIKITQLS